MCPGCCLEERKIKSRTCSGRYWRFQCEHRLLSIQVTAEVERVGKEKVPVRRELPGLGEEVKEAEPTPAFPGLELSVQLRLVEMLETAAKIWRTRKFSPSEWFSAKTICQFQLSAAFSLQLLGHSGLAVGVFRTVLETARDNEVWEEKSLLALWPSVEHVLWTLVEEPLNSRVMVPAQSDSSWNDEALQAYVSKYNVHNY